MFGDVLVHVPDAHAMSMAPDASALVGVYSADGSLATPLHFPWATWMFLAVVRVNTAPQMGHSALATTPDFSRWWRSRLLKVENSRPLHP